MILGFKNTDWQKVRFVRSVIGKLCAKYTRTFFLCFHFAFLLPFVSTGCISNKTNMLTSLAPLAPALTARVDGVDVNYTASILTNGRPTLILVHGFGASLQTWHDIYPSLASRFSVVRVDLKGSGFSSKPADGKYAPADQANLLVNFLKKIGQTNIVLVGHSLGGGVVLMTYFESLAPSCGINVKGLVLIDSAGYLQKLPFFVSATRNPFLRFVATFMTPRFRAKFVLSRIVKVKDVINSDRIYRYAFFLDMPGSQAALNQTARQILPPNAGELTSRFSDIDVPTLIIWGMSDSVIPVDNAHRFKNQIVGSQLVLLQDTGHIPHEERPEMTLAAMEQFMEGLK